MRIGISLLTMRSEFRGEHQEVQMVKVRDLDHPERFGLAGLRPPDIPTLLTEQEQFDAALATAMRRLVEK